MGSLGVLWWYILKNPLWWYSIVEIVWRISISLQSESESTVQLAQLRAQLSERRNQD